MAGSFYCWGGGSSSPLVTPTVLNDGGLAFSYLRGNSDELLCGTRTDGGVYCIAQQFEMAATFRDLLTKGFSQNTALSIVPGTGSGGVALSDVVLGTSLACGLTASDHAYCQGFNSRGQVGNGTRNRQSTALAPVSGGLTFTSLAASAETVCGVAATGALYCWGADNLTAPGDSSSTDQLVPVLRTTGNFTQVSAGMAGMCALDPAGIVHCWGGGRAAYGTDVDHAEWSGGRLDLGQ